MSNKDFVLSVEGLTVSFDGFKAVDDLSFYVEEGELVSSITQRVVAVFKFVVTQSTGY
jgi:ABC-type uncharacterized transport system ATPase subunit